MVRPGGDAASGDSKRLNFLGCQDLKTKSNLNDMIEIQKDKLIKTLCVVKPDGGGQTVERYALICGNLEFEQSLDLKPSQVELKHRSGNKK